MAGSTGSARQEAERLVATVLAMAGESDDLSRTRQRLTEGIGALGDTLASVVGQFTGESAGRSSPAASSAEPSGGACEATSAASEGERPAADNPTGQGTGGQGAGGQPAAGSGSGGQGSRGQAKADQQHGWHEAGGQWIGGWGWVARGLSGWTGGRGSGHGSAGWSTGSAECCVCPICRAIAAVRDPSPETAVRLATGAGDLATGVARAMRAFSTLGGTRPAQRTKPARPTRPVYDPDIAWSAATRTTGEGGRHEAPMEDLDPETSDPWAAATRAANRPAPTGGRHEAPASPSAAGPEGARQQAPSSAAGPQAAKQPVPPRKPAPPAPGADPWAAATAAYGTRGGADLAATPSVDHDVPGPVDAGRAETESAPVASAAEDRDAGTGDDAGARDAR